MRSCGCALPLIDSKLYQKKSEAGHGRNSEGERQHQQQRTPVDRFFLRMCRVIANPLFGPSMDRVCRHSLRSIWTMANEYRSSNARLCLEGNAAPAIAGVNFCRQTALAASTRTRQVELSETHVELYIQPVVDNPDRGDTMI